MKTNLFNIKFPSLGEDYGGSHDLASGRTDACTWTITGITGNYTLTISGNGAMENHGPRPWYSCQYDIKTIVIQDGITTIGAAAFSLSTGLTGVTIPNSVTTICDSAFYYCSGLVAITIPDSVTTIGNAAFAGCIGLAGITIPNSVAIIGERAFGWCAGLIAVTNLNPVPQDIYNSTVFNNVNIGACTLRVPAGSVEAYQTAPVWRDFGYIESIE